MDLFTLDKFCLIKSTLVMKILVATEKPFAAIAVNGIKDIIEKAGFEFVLLEKYTDKKQLLDAVADATALIIRSDKVDEEVMAAAPQLKIVVRAGAGYDNVDLNAATSRNIVVMNTPGQNSNAVAELVVGLLLMAVRNNFNGSSGSELMGKKIGLMAFGAVAQNLARIAKGLGMTVMGYSPTGHPEKIANAGFEVAETPEQLFAECDVVSLHIPANAQTKECINYALLSKMKKKAILVNSARKEVINEGDLLRIMTEREDLRYYSDLQLACHDEAIEKLGSRYFATPKKMGAQTAEANINAGLAAARQIVSFLKEGCTQYQVNK